YADLRNVRKRNRDLQDEVARLQMEQVRLKQDADQAHRLQALLEFKERFVAKTLAAQVIGTSGTEQSRVIIIDKGSRDGVRNDMAVITPDGIVGKVKDVFPLSSQVLLINDHDSGAGVILESSRLQGILKGTSVGELQITGIMSDEKIDAGEHVITSGGDRIFPKGLSVGTVSSSSPDRDNDPFLSIRIKPSADLQRLEEVLVITRQAEETPAVATGSLRAADILSQRLPSIPKQDPNAPKTPGATASPTPAPAAKPDSTAKEPKKESATNAAGVKLPSVSGEAGSGKPPATANKPAAGGATGTGPAATPKLASKAPASTGQTSPTPTPTPKPKATPAKKMKAPASPDATQGTPETKQPETPPPTPTATPERLR
ncbi:MAG TPA: rod shape-determining protein MreC, partial [Candidatus Sulfotelmatobacter sp.]|nr:rod shape-determining protein MreC [Candidatus Sulfotelmatobacter sp.]